MIYLAYQTHTDVMEPLRALARIGAAALNDPSSTARMNTLIATNRSIGNSRFLLSVQPYHYSAVGFRLSGMCAADGERAAHAEVRNVVRRRPRIHPPLHQLHKFG